MADDHPRSPHRSLRFALITDGGSIEAWQVRALRLVPDILACAVLHLEVALPATTTDHTGPLATRLWRLYERRRLLKPGRARQRRSVRAVAADLPATRCDLEPHGGRWALPRAATDQIREASCDFVVNLTGAPILGVHGSIAAHGLWEHRVTAGDRTTAAHRHVTATQPALLEVSLVRVGEQPQDDAVLQRGWVHSVPHSLAATIDAAHFATVEWLARACREISVRGGVQEQDPPIPSPPTTLQGPSVLPAVLRSPWRKLRRVLRAPFWQEEWHIGIVDRPLEDLFHTQRLGQPRWLERPSRRYYLADPFALDDSSTILAEAYDYLTHTGHIAAVGATVDARRPTARPIMRTAGHMSYPYLFRHDSNVYCVPETCDQRRVTLHRAVRYPHVWEEVAVLVEGIAAADPTIVRHDDLWWLFCTDDDRGPGSNLHLFYATDLTGPWQPHALNPVKIDIRSARPAGTPFIVDGRLIRPAQDNTRGYGSAVVFNDVEVLRIDAFRERVAARLDPPARGRFRFGLHTVSPWGDRTLIDGKRKGPSMMNLMGRVLRRVR